MKKLTSFVLYLILTLCPVMAQGFRLSGQITDTSGEPVPGATVMITGTDIGTMADADGKFILDVKSGLSPEATLTLSSLGFKDLVVLVGKKTVFNVTLEEENNVLEETVVIGYSTVKKKDLTGSLTSVEGDAVRTRQTATVPEALQGAMPGVTVTRSSSAPGGEATIRVRGITSMTSGPLIRTSLSTEFRGRSAMSTLAISRTSPFSRMPRQHPSTVRRQPPESSSSQQKGRRRMAGQACPTITALAWTLRPRCLNIWTR